MACERCGHAHARSPTLEIAKGPVSSTQLARLRPERETSEWTTAVGSTRAPWGAMTASLCVVAEQLTYTSSRFFSISECRSGQMGRRLASARGTRETDNPATPPVNEDVWGSVSWADSTQKEQVGSLDCRSGLKGEAHMHNREISQMNWSKRAKRGGRGSCLHDSSGLISRLSAQCLSLELKYVHFVFFFVFMASPPTI